MNKISSRSALLIALLAAVAMAGCAGMNRQERNTTTGAVIGGVTGAVITDGSPAGAAVGAVVGGVIGHEVDKKKK
jgi:osmotically inducible lipoprotein OsmB